MTNESSLEQAKSGKVYLHWIILCLCLHGMPRHLGKMSPTFPAELFSVDARFTRKIEKPQKGIKWPVTTK